MDAIQASFDCSDLENPMGERRKDALSLNFDRKLKLEFHGTKVTGVQSKTCQKARKQKVKISHG